MNKTINPFLIFVIMSICTGNGYSENVQMPQWLDTIAPIVKVSPDSKYHNTLFLVSISSNKRSNIWFSVGNAYNFKRYTKPFTIDRQGVCPVYFYGEDDFGNRSKMDSIVYTLDSRPPLMKVFPSPGTYPNPISIKVTTDEPCTFFYQKNKQSQLVAFTDSLIVKDSFKGFIVAEDKAGNRSRTDYSEFFIDTSSFNLKIDPAGGIFNRCQLVTLSASENVNIYYSFDPLSAPDYFNKYEKPFRLPHGLTVLRYFGKRAGNESEIYRARYVVDTIAPKLHYDIFTGLSADTLIFSTREKTIIRYTLDKTIPNINSTVYNEKLIVEHRGLSTVKARAWDEAGNVSDVVVWQYKYDHQPPQISISHNSGSYSRALNVAFTSNEPVRVFYTLDGSAVTEKSHLLKNTGIVISKNGSTVLKYFAIDESGNRTPESTVDYFLDTRVPEVKVRIESNFNDTTFTVNLSVDEPAVIYYSANGNDPDQSSSVYSEPLQLQFGQVLKYFAVDNTGNRSSTKTMDELRRPMIIADPDGGVFNRKLKVSFKKNCNGTVYWRNLSDSVFQKLSDYVNITEDGIHNIEYYIESEAGIRSATRRSVYFIDKTTPFVQVNLRKGNQDSVIVFFECSEPASIYFTIDGSNPLLSSTVRSLGNRFNQSSDRVVLKRQNDLKLAFYAIDAAGNQSPVSILDIFRPRAVPNVPAGVNRLYDRILSITLNSYDQSTIYFERHGKKPSTLSNVFSEPLTLLSSDTITAFVIDASGYRGDVDTFIYHIDLPPSPQFSIYPDTIYRETDLIFNPAASLDKESPFETLKFRWDFNGDGTFDTDYEKYRKVSYKFDKSGLYEPILEVMDSNKRKAKIAKKLLVRERCSQDMASVIDMDGHAFCIDKYEWPNKPGTKPEVNVNWVEAKMLCIDAGKRLCTQKEWEAACNANVKSIYPYGDKYNGTVCPTEGKQVWNSGTFSKCNKYGISDMLGNTWEWVDSKDGDYRIMMGGSYLSGKNAHCSFKAAGTVASRSNETGFRCCK